MKPRALTPTILMTLLCPFLVFGETTDPHNPVGVRKSTVTEESLEASDGSQGEIAEETEHAGLLNQYPSIYYPNSTHWIIGISALGDSVEIEDGSVWKLGIYDRYEALSWQSTDPISISQNTSWFSKYKYRLTNNTTYRSVEANLHQSPIKEGQYTLYINRINPARGEILLNDNTYWEVDSSYNARKKIRDWAVGDAIIIGHNAGWSLTLENILINVTMDEFLPAKQF